MSTPLIFNNKKTPQSTNKPVFIGALLSLIVFSYFFSVPSFILSLILLGIFIHFADRIGFVDVPNFRSSHRKITPSSSGIAFFLAVGIGAFFTDVTVYENYGMTIVAALLVLSVGIIDDLKGLRARHKIIFIALASLLSLSEGFLVTHLGSYFGGTLSLMWLSMPFTVFAVVGFTNSFNLIDGLDGLQAL